jgi:predicted RNA-binding protein with RPS1 domain
MKVIFKQSGRGWIQLCIETSNVCTIIDTSVVFDPYERLYIWLGQIRDAQLPTSIIIDEEGYGVELIAEPDENDTVFFHIEPWLSRADRIICGKETLDRRELVEAFHEGIVDFVNNRFVPSKWSSIDDYLNHQNWNALIDRNIKPQDWNKRLLMLQWRTFLEEQSADNSDEDNQINSYEESLMVLRSVLMTIGRIDMSNYKHIQAFANLYQKLPVDIALNEVDRNWYREKRIQLDEDLKRSTSNYDREKVQRRRDLQKLRLQSLKVGQVVDGTVVGIKHYGLFVNIGGIAALLHNSEISELQTEDLNKVFQQNDWVRAIIIDLDIERSRVTLSTKVLEPEAGDMLNEPWKVYENAEEMAIRYRQAILTKASELD